MTRHGPPTALAGRGPAGRRLFVAVPFPAEAIEQIADARRAVRAEGVPGGGRDVRWVRLDGLHLTLRFLGPTLDDRIAAGDPRRCDGGQRPGRLRHRDRWRRDVSAAAAGRGRCGSTCARARTDLVGLAACVDAALTGAGWTLEPKPFRPHLTLARSDGVPAGAAIGARLIEAAAELDVRFRADRSGCSRA